MARSKSKRGAGGSRSKSSARWLARQRKDPFTRKAVAEGRISRAQFKLEQLDLRFKLLRGGMRVLELGAAPGGWTRYVEARLAGGLLVVCDTRQISAGPGTVVIDGACGEAQTDARIDEALDGRPVDLVLSDMAPNISGIRASDQALAMELVGIAEAAADRWLKPGGSLVVKVFQGEGVDAWVPHIRRKFSSVRMVKPRASRAESREVFAVAEKFQPKSK
jgi:23S rRNA (uridine2552-2'-O)-methyltransferase